MMKAALCGALAALCLGGIAHANAADDGNAGLTALNASNYDQAISLFTRAIDSRELRGDDEESAYACRGRAYLKKGDYSDAIADLDRARRTKPDDADAQNDLIAAVSAELPADQMPGLPKASFWGQLGQAVVAGAAAGIAAGLAGDSQ
jgi:tetratricopeptide (TPR) repeat protein